MFYGWKKGWLLGAALIGASIFLLWWYLQPQGFGKDFASGNGRIEAVDIDIATKVAGRVKDIKVDEGDYVSAGEVVANMDTETLEAQIREAKAQEEQAKSSVVASQSQVRQRQSEKDAALAVVSQREAELDLLKKRFERTQTLAKRNIATADALDEARAHFYSAQASLSSAKAQVAAADTAIVTAQSQVIGDQFLVVARKATIERLQADLKDSALKAPRDGRVQYRVAQPGEVLSAGGKVLNMIDLSDVYMNFFLPTDEAGKVHIGGEVRLILDAAPKYVIPAKVSFVADVAQFTPKTVETASERQKLMFRIKARIAPALLKKYIHSVKTGLPGVAYIKLNPDTPWPKELQVKLPHD
ncbi:HlyD family secretion protein [Legionella maioricensis]|uniref:HlyD family efflux transporter periplasmic adaptor subunit n=1 Tax=Legionella maioricensis TaxID=2896528 RepID=A0A9X2D2X7_9GAMM|nr:HlyD family efflux transporter periplasmic adaptor subunit [Legionella maioricensis]MCL9685263.1 HlyD family efflux transporter periplasmic adaptor subunit [Legionella maioricensis]MCL9688480.1 HlyD family efflux transporter periplasmic adaptor subunit [Legionella maioricensis]